jgi:hypothetical protein
MSAARTRKKPHTPTVPTSWDEGASGQANRLRLVEESAIEVDPRTGKRSNPNGVRRVRRKSWVEVYHNQGNITLDQMEAARRLYEAFHGHKAGDAMAALVIDNSNNTYSRAIADIDRRAFLHKIWGPVPTQLKPVVKHVVIDDEAIWGWDGTTNQRQVDRDMQRLMEGLNHVHKGIMG